MPAMWVSSLSGVKNLACDEIYSELYTEKNQGLTARWGKVPDCGFLQEALSAKGLWQAWVE